MDRWVIVLAADRTVRGHDRLCADVCGALGIRLDRRCRAHRLHRQAHCRGVSPLRRATLSNPPLFALTEQVRGRMTLTSDTGAVAHLFFLEEDIARLLLLTDGTVTSPPSWAIAPGADDVT